MDSPNPVVVEMAMIKQNRSHYKTKRHKLKKEQVEKGRLLKMWGRWDRVRRESNQNVYYMCGTNKEPKYRVKSFERKGKLST